MTRENEVANVVAVAVAVAVAVINKLLFIHHLKIYLLHISKHGLHTCTSRVLAKARDEYIIS